MTHFLRKEQGWFLLYLLGFYATWTAWVLLGYPRLRLLGEQTFLYMLINVVVRALVWVLPIFIYLRYVKRVGPTRYLKLREHWRSGLLAAVMFSILNFLFFMAQRGLPHLRAEGITWNSLLSTTFLIGFIEELPYRGFIFQQLNEWFSLSEAAVISSLLFVAIHLPGWISLHLFRTQAAIFIFVFGLLMVALLRYSKSLWAPIVSHSLNDFFSVVLFRM
jgi:CAAX amino terminal protease family.